LPWQAVYPTHEHQGAAQAIVEHFRSDRRVAAILLTNSCARGKATRDSCLDMAILVDPGSWTVERLSLQADWETFLAANQALQELRRAGRYSEVHLDFVDGVFSPEERDEAAGPDSFELGIGNLLAYGQPLVQNGGYLQLLKDQWLPYYGEGLRRERLGMVRHYCLGNLGHVPWYVERGLYFQAFDRLYNAYREFLQALFIARRTYPIAYNKWIREQVEEILGLPELYAQLPHLFELGVFESAEIAQKAARIERLLAQHAPAPEA
jgi:predicted nucleotidyltransferase